MGESLVNAAKFQSGHTDQVELRTWIWGNNILLSLLLYDFLFLICRYVTTGQSQSTVAL